MLSNIPYDETNSKNPWLLNNKSHPAIIGPEGKPLTAEYIWSKQGKEREALVEWVFEYYRTRGFPFFKLTDQELKDEFVRLKGKNAQSILEDGVIKNSDTTGLDIAKHFTNELFLNAKSTGKSKSCLEVFNDDVLFKNVLKNRMGWCVSSEGGETRTYVFGISDSMITQGMRSSGLAYSISHFKPTIAKFIYEKYKVKSTLDYSAGWGARCIAALSLGVKYYGIDPLTSDKITKMIEFFNGSGFCVNDCSEDTDFNKFPMVDLCFSSPPFFDLEIYADDLKQSSKYKKYEDWLEKYWRATIKKCYGKSKYFSFLAVEKVKKFNLLEDMKRACIEEGGILIENFPIKTSKSHLSSKAKTKSVDKKTEHLLVFEIKNV